VKERLLTLVLALGALALFYTLLFPKPTPEDERASQPLSTDGGPDGELAIWRWLQQEAIPLASLRYRYDRLAALTGSAGHNKSGNVLITWMPHRVPLRAEEWQPLNHWLESGNTVVVMAALDDTPSWSLRAGPQFLEELRRYSGVAFRVGEQQGKNNSADQPHTADTPQSALRKLLGNPDIAAEPRGQHALLAEVHSIHGTSELPASRWLADPKASVTPLALLQRSDNHDPLLWILHRGQGQVLMCALATPFSNGQIDQGDNAKLLSNIIAWSRATTGSVIFDDAHQGLSAYYDQKAFYADPRLHRTLCWMLFLWLAFVLGPLPLRSAYTAWKPVDETALIEASGRFYSAAVSPLDAAHRLFENFFNRLRRRLNLPENGEPLWQWLDAQSPVPAERRALLQRLYARLHAGERAELCELQNLLTEIEGTVA
jgi:hypothetical protein